MFVYIMTNKYRGTLYIGVTNDLLRRATEHRENVLEGFTKKYGLHRLVYYQDFDDPYDAIAYEKRLKNWRREWKITLIEEKNIEWSDLYNFIAGG